MNSVRAIMGATQVGGRGRRVYGGREAFYGFDCRCSDGEMTKKWQKGKKNANVWYKGEQMLQPLLSDEPPYRSKAENEKILAKMQENLRNTTDPVKKERLRAKIEEFKVNMNKQNIEPSIWSTSSQANSRPATVKPNGTDSSTLPPTSSNKPSNTFANQNPYGELASGKKGAKLFPNGFTSGGARKRKARKATSSRKANAEKYRKFLDGLDVKRLQKIAKTKGIKITKKKDGKTVYCKKATIVSKLFKFKYGK